MALFGFIGVGNMGGAMAKAAAKALGGADIYVSAKHPEKAQAFAAQIGAKAVDNACIAAHCDYIVLGVKPQFMEEVLSPLQTTLANRKDAVLISMAAGLTMETIAAMAGIHLLVQRPEAAGVIIADMVGIDHDKSIFLFHFSFPPESFAPLYMQLKSK